MRAVAPALLAALTLTACDGGGDPVQQALRETAAANQSARVKETATFPTEPGPADRAWVARMIEHHRDAVAMAETALARSRDPEIRRMAQTVKDAGTREIAEMQAWTPAAPSDQ